MGEQNSQLHILSNFIQLEKEARQASTIEEFGFTVCNNTKKLFAYQQALFWQMQTLGVHVQTISATATINQDAPFVVWVNKLVKHTLKLEKANTVTLLSKDDYPEAIAKQWEDWLPDEVLWCPYIDDKKQVLAGMLFTRQYQWHEHEIQLLKELINTYNHAWLSLVNRRPTVLKKLSIKKHKKWVYGTLAVIFFILLLPIRQSVLAPGEIVAHEPEVISVSVDGVIQKIHVQPNQEVKEGQLLFSLDPITFENQYEQAEKSLQVAMEKYRKAYQHAFTDPDSKSELPILHAEVEKSRAEVAYSKKLMERIKIHAPSDGIIIYSNPKDWIGKPVKVGERIMQVANPSDKELDVELPVADAINLDKKQTIKFFLNVTPLKPVYAKLRYVSYSASETAQDTLVYHLKADFTIDQTIPRIGLKGTAKLYGKRVTVFYYLFWRPISYVRRTLGI